MCLKNLFSISRTSTIPNAYVYLWTTNGKVQTMLRPTSCKTNWSKSKPDLRSSPRCPKRIRNSKSNWPNKNCNCKTKIEAFASWNVSSIKLRASSRSTTERQESEISRNRQMLRFRKNPIELYRSRTEGQVIWCHLLIWQKSRHMRSIFVRSKQPSKNLKRRLPNIRPNLCRKIYSLKTRKPHL